MNKSLVKKQKDANVNEVDAEEARDFDKEIFVEKVKIWIKEETVLESTKHALYEIVWGQCSELMQNRLTADSNFEKIFDDGDVSELLKLMRGISLQVETNIPIYNAVNEAKRRYYRMYQGE